MRREATKQILLLLIVLGLITCILAFVLNIRLKQKIEYYESSQGVFERALNDSAEREYKELLRERNTLLVLGLFGFIVSIGSYGMYRSTNWKNNVEFAEVADS